MGLDYNCPHHPYRTSGNKLGQKINDGLGGDHTWSRKFLYEMNRIPRWRSQWSGEKMWKHLDGSAGECACHASPATRI